MGEEIVLSDLVGEYGYRKRESRSKKELKAIDRHVARESLVT